jgi:hypothetical protein
MNFHEKCTLGKEGKMKTNRSLYPVLITVLALLLFGGCATLRSGGVASIIGPNGEVVTLQDLVKNWEAYDIYYAGLSDDTPAALLFDPRNDDKTLSGKRWKKVEDQKLLASMVDFIQKYTLFDPRLYSIVGPDHQVYGYVFSPTNEVRLKVVDEKTIYVYEVESPLYKDKGRDVGLAIHGH